MHRPNTIEFPQGEAFDRALVESSRDCIKVLSVDGRLLWMNDEGKRLLCIGDLSAVLGKSWIDFWADEDRIAAEKAIAAAVGGGSGSFTAMYMVAGEERWFDVLVSPIRSQNNKTQNLLAVSRDITARKRLEDSLRRSEERFEMVGRATNDAIWDWDIQTNSLWWNQGVTNLFGYEPTQIVPDISWWYDRVHPYDCERIWASVGQAIESSELSWRAEYRFRRADGSYADVLDRGYVIRDKRGKAIRMIGAMRDTSERKRAEEALRESEQRFRAIADDAPIFIWMADEKINVTYVNRTYLDYLGLRTAGDFSGRVWERLMHPDDISRTHDIYLAAVKSGQTFQLEVRMRSAAAAEHRWHLFRGTPRFIEGRFAGFMGVGIDIEDRKRFEQSLQDSEAKLRSVIEEAPLAIALLGRSGEILFRNPRFDQLWGRPVHVTTARTYSQVYEGYHLDGRRVASEEWPGARAVLKGEVTDNLLFEIVQASGRRVTCWFGGAPICNASGEIEGGVVVFRDVSEERRTENELRASERRFRSFVEATAHVIWRTDAHGEIDTSLEEWCAFTGQSEEEARGFGWTKAIHPEDQAKVAGAWQKASETRSIYEVQYRLKIHNGQWRDILARGVPVLNDQGEVVEYIGTCIDITEQKKAEQALRDSEQRLERMVAERTADLRATVAELEAFSYSLSHDMRAPLRTIQSFSQIVLHDASSKLGAREKDLLTKV